jgi:hypothetical protein
MRTGTFLFFFVFLHMHILVFATREPDYIVLSATTKISVRAGKLEIESSCRIQVNNKNGDKSGKVKIPFSSKDRILSLKAWIQDTSGNIIRELGKKELHDISAELESTFYSDYFYRTFELHHNIYPYQFCFSYVKSMDEFYYITDWTPVYEYEARTVNASLIAEFPSGYKVNILQKNISLPVVDSSGGLIHYEWHTSYDSILRKEEFSLPLEENVPRVTISPIDFFYSIHGSMKSWDSFGDYVANLVGDSYSLTDQENQAVQTLTASIVSPVEKVRVLYHYLQDHTRYINVSINTGGLKPYPAEYVCEKHYGDCKALSVYMQALLKAAGVRSYYAKVCAGENAGPVDKRIPWQQFNHIIVFVPLDNDTLWLECTSNVDPFAYVGVFIQDRDAFIIEKGRSRFIRTPALELESVKEMRTFYFEPDSAGNARVNLKQTVRGHDFELFRYVKSNLNDNIKQYFFHEVLPFKDFQVNRFSISQENRDTPEISLNLELNLPHSYSTYSSEQSVNLPSSGLPEFERPARRKSAVNIPYPIYKEDSVFFRIPPGYNPVVPAEVQFEQEYGSIRISCKNTGHYVLVHRIIVIRKGCYPGITYGDFYAFISKIKEYSLKSKVTFKQ